MLHVVEKKAGRAKAEAGMASFCDVKLPRGVSVETVIEVGEFEDRIGQYAEEMDATLVVMGSKGVHGLQKMVGSRALKLVAESKVSFIVTQREVSDDEVLDRIAVPITLEKEDKKILSTVAAIAKQVNASVFFIYEDKDDEFLAATISRNLNFAKSYLQSRA